MRPLYREYEGTYYRIYREANTAQSVTLETLFEKASIKVIGHVPEQIVKQANKIKKPEFDRAYKSALELQKPIKSKKRQ